MRRPSAVALVFLMQAMLTGSAARAQADAPPPHVLPNASGTAQSNVVLGRELINLTKQMESLLRLQQGAFYLRGRLAEFRIDSQINLDSAKSVLKAQREIVEGLKTDLGTIREQLSKMTADAQSVPDQASRQTSMTDAASQGDRLNEELQHLKQIVQRLADAPSAPSIAPSSGGDSSGAGSEPASSLPPATPPEESPATAAAPTTNPAPSAATGAAPAPLPPASTAPAASIASPPTPAASSAAPPSVGRDNPPGPSPPPAAERSSPAVSIEARYAELKRLSVRLSKVVDVLAEVQRTIEPQIASLDSERRALNETKWSLAGLRSQLHINDSLLLSIRSGGADGAYDPNRPTYSAGAFSAPQSTGSYIPNPYDYSQSGLRGFDGGTSSTGNANIPDATAAASNPQAALLEALSKVSLDVDKSQRDLNGVSRLIDQADAIVVECAAISEKQRATHAELEKDVQRQMTDCQSLYDELGRIKRKNEYDLQSSDANLNQFAINKQLVWAVYGMISTIVVLFILLRLYPGSLTNLIVGQRLLVEVLSMGFLLVTVIILGSGKLIQGEGLSGLLGTIAGYIFARKTAEIATHVPPSAHAAAYLTEEGRSAEAEAKKLRKELEAEKAKIPQGAQATSEQTAEWEKLEKRAAELEEKAKTFAAMAEKATNVRTPPLTEPPPAV